MFESRFVSLVCFQFRNEFVNTDRKIDREERERTGIDRKTTQARNIVSVSTGQRANGPTTDVNTNDTTSKKK